MKIQLPSAVSTRVARQLLVAQKHSPRVLFATGLGLMGATVVTACRGTLQLEAVLDDIKSDRDDVRAVALNHPEKYSDRDVAKLNAYVTAKGVARIAKLYLPSLALGVAAVACLTSSHNQLTRRNAGLSAALAATERALDSYRQRVRDELGDDRERKIWRNERTETVPVLDDEGRETKSTKKVKRGGGYSQYARLWGRDTSSEFDPNSDYNLAKLRHVQNLCTMTLQHKGHLFLNEVYDELGLERTPEGQVVGWLRDEGDNFVDFGILSDDPEEGFLDFVTGYEDHIWLDFNVAGAIWEKI